jgi:hypothetical protein
MDQVWLAGLTAFAVIGAVFVLVDLIGGGG